MKEISESAGFSPFHFHRIFAAYVGETPGEYIRRKRLERSLIFLLQSNERITDIAFKVEFDSSSAFSKAFRQYYSCSPTQARRDGGVPQPKLIYIALQKNERRKDMDVKIIELPDQRFIFAAAKGKVNSDYTRAADVAFREISRFVAQNNLWQQVELCLGMTPDESENTAPEESRYWGGYTLKPEARVETSGDIHMGDVPGGKYAVFRHKSPSDSLWQTWNAIYRHWLPASGFKLRDVEPFEVFLNDKTKTKPSNLLTDIYIGIE